MARLVRRLFARVSDPARPARLRSRLWLQSLERRIAPANFTVANTNDSGAGSLRQAVLSANSASGADTIDFDATAFATPQTIFLTSGQITISGSTTITGRGANIVTVSGNNSTRVFTISGSGVINVTITGMTITGGRIDPIVSATKSGNGAGILIANENVTLDSVVVSGNSITAGTFDSGAAISVGANGVTSGGLLTIRNSAITGNQTNGLGGGVYFYNNGALLVENSTISGNSAGNVRGGGGIYFYGTAATSGTLTGLTVRNSTVANNTAGIGSGGGVTLHSFGSTLLVQNSTIANNLAGTTDTTDGAGGGGLSLPEGSGTFNLQSTIVSGNTAANGRSDITAVLNGGTVVADHSAIGSATGFTLAAASTSNLPFGADLKLDPNGLQNNGGPTPTIALLTGSAAIDHGANPAGLTTDQRGGAFARVNFLPDIGAVEVASPSRPVASLGSAPTVTTNGGTSYSFQVVYADGTAINVGSLDNFDVRVTGPGSFNQLATFDGVTPTGNGTPRTATYHITPPGNSWDSSDFGTYSIALEPNQVAQVAPASPATVAAGPIGTFLVQPPATFTVTNASDAGNGSLRDAIAQANAHAGTADTIVFDPAFFGVARTITLTSGELLISDPVTITGPGANLLTVRRDAAAAQFRIVEVNGPGVLDVALSGMTITGGSTTGIAGAGTDGDGGGLLLVDENLTLTNVTVTGNVSGTEGGGIGVGGGGGSLTVRNCTITGNMANGPFSSSFTGAGGGIYSGYGTAMLVENSTISGNASANGKAGGIYFYSAGSGGLTVRNSTISGNVAAQGNGGIRFYTPSESLLIEGSTISGNTGGAKGAGGLYFYGKGGGSLTVRNSTISGNVAPLGGGLYFYGTNATMLVEGSTISGNSATTGVGGGIYYYAGGGGGLTVRNSTITGNSAAFSGGGIGFGKGDSLLVQNCTITGNTASGTAATDGGGGIAEPVAGSPPLTVVSSIVSGNSSANGPDILSGGTVNVNFSAIGSQTGFTPSAASGNNLPVGTALNLQPLADNGGPTQTMALGAGSPALNKGSNPGGLTTDQRGPGFLRVSGAAADIGAFELQTGPPPVPPHVTNVQTNAGGQQRSTVTSVTVTFDTVVTFAGTVAAGFTLVRQTDGAAVTFTGSAATIGGVTVVTLTGFSGTAAAGRSLSNGRYTLTALAAQITGNTLPLDGNGDGTGGDNFTFADSGTTTGNQLYRLFGDGDGNRVVNQADLALFRIAFGSSDGTFDVDGNGVVNQADLVAFRTNFGVTV